MQRPSRSGRGIIRSTLEHGRRSFEDTKLPVRAVLVFCLLAQVAGCGTVYVNKEDRKPRYLKETEFVSSRNVEITYRRLYKMLYRCTSGYYRIQGDYDLGKSHAEISVDTGVGFQNDAFLADSHVMRVDIDAEGLDKSRVRIRQTSRQGAPYSGAMASWVNEGSDDCAAGS